MTGKHIVPLLIALTGSLYHGPSNAADPKSFNGTWVLDVENSQNLEDAGKERNKELMYERRLKHKQEFDRSSGTPSGKRGGMFAHAAATAEIINDDARPLPWEVTEEVEAMIEAESIKLYFARKIAILYGSERKRLLKVNTSGRSFSVSGSAVTKDEIGTSMTYVEDGSIVVETDTRWRDRMVERFALNDTAEQLSVTIRLQQVGQGPWLEYVRVFDRTN